MSKTSVLRTVTRSSTSNNTKSSTGSVMKNLSTAMKTSNVVGVNNIHHLQQQRPGLGTGPATSAVTGNGGAGAFQVNMQPQRHLNGREAMMAKALTRTKAPEKAPDNGSIGKATTGNFSLAIARSKEQRVQNPASIEIVEILSDTEDKDVPQRVNGITNKTSRKTNSPRNSSHVSGNVQESTTPPNRTTDIESYYISKGLTLSHVRRLNKNYVRHDGPSSEAGGVVFWDSFSPPPGFTMADLPASDSPGQLEPIEDVVSPAILNAAKYKLRPRPIIKVSNSEDEFQAILKKLTKRKANKENSPQPKKKSTPELREETTRNVVNSPNLNLSFPEDDMNDSMIILLSQVAEGRDYTSSHLNENDKNGTKIDCKANSSKKRNRKTESREGPIKASTPVSAAKGVASGLTSVTPKSARGGHWQSKKCAQASHSNSTSSVFENSGSGGRSEARRRSGIPIPRRSLFGSFEEVANCDTAKTTCGDFMDDDDDELFSQIQLPCDESYGVNNKKTENNLDQDFADQSTQIINQSDDSFLKHGDILAEIDKLEEMAINRTEKMNRAGNNAAISLVDDLKRQQLSKKKAGKLPKTTTPRISPRTNKGCGKSFNRINRN